MATKHKRRTTRIPRTPQRARRINVTFKPSVLRLIDTIAKTEGASLSNVAQELVEEALEMREDIYLSRLADEAEERSKGKPRIPAHVVWKELGLE